jgi:hypothetical protein
MKLQRVSTAVLLLSLFVTVALGDLALLAAPPPAGDPPGRDSILDWNAIALEANKQDHSGTYGAPEQGGPTRSSRALAIVHVAMYDALNSIEPKAAPYLTSKPSPGASIDAAVAKAARDTLMALYPKQGTVFNVAYNNYLAAIPNGAAKSQGIKVGDDVAKAILKARQNDGSFPDPVYQPGQFPGEHRVDPLNPGQGFLTPGWGSVKTFGILRGTQFRAVPPPSLTSSEYTNAFREVQSLGGDGIITPTKRSREQTEIGIFWAYDGAKGIGTPPRLYNQIARKIAIQKGNSEIQNARLFALVNIAMADAGITSWETKYFYNFWRPVLGIREADPGTGPTGLGDGNNRTKSDPTWTPLGAPASNRSGNDFTPPFPAYTSGHATFGAAMFRVLENFYGTDKIPFEFMSDELNGITTDSRGVVRPRVVRKFKRLSDAAWENAESRIYLGIHWRFDATAGVGHGVEVADHVFDNVLRPRK